MLARQIRRWFFQSSIRSTGDYNGNVTGNCWMVMEGIREQSIYPYQYGWGGCTVDPKLWNTFAATDARRFASITSIADEGRLLSPAAKLPIIVNIPGIT